MRKKKLDTVNLIPLLASAEEQSLCPVTENIKCVASKWPRGQNNYFSGAVVKF